MFKQFAIYWFCRGIVFGALKGKMFLKIFFENYTFQQFDAIKHPFWPEFRETRRDEKSTREARSSKLSRNREVETRLAATLIITSISNLTTKWWSIFWQEKEKNKNFFHLEHTVPYPEEIQNWLDFISNFFPRVLVSLGQLELAPVLVELHSHLHRQVYIIFISIWK